VTSPIAFAWAALGITGIAAIFDWRTGRIPSWLSLGTLFVAPIAHALATRVQAGGALGGLALAGLGAACAGAPPLLLWRLGGIGGGDVKLVAAAGALLGPTLGVESLLYACLLAGSYAVLRMAWDGSLLRTIRFGPALCAGVALAVVLPGALS